jgi:hypothetical protein
MLVAKYHFATVVTRVQTFGWQRTSIFNPAMKKFWFKDLNPISTSVFTSPFHLKGFALQMFL